MSMNDLDILLKELQWVKKNRLFYIENGSYCLLADFQKSSFSKNYYIDLTYTEKKNDHKYSYYDSPFHISLTNARIGFTSYTVGNILQTNKLQEKFTQVTGDFLKVKSRKEMVDFIHKEILIGDYELPPVQVERLKIIPEYENKTRSLEE